MSIPERVLVAHNGGAHQPAIELPAACREACGEICGVEVAVAAIVATLPTVAVLGQWLGPGKLATITQLAVAGLVLLSGYLGWRTRCGLPRHAPPEPFLGV